MSNFYALQATTLISRLFSGLETILTMKSGLNPKILNWILQEMPLRTSKTFSPIPQFILCLEIMKTFSVINLTQLEAVMIGSKLSLEIFGKACSAKILSMSLRRILTILLSMKIITWRSFLSIPKLVIHLTSISLKIAASILWTK